MKRRDLVAELERGGCTLLRHGAKHDIYHQPKTGRSDARSRCAKDRIAANPTHFSFFKGDIRRARLRVFR